MMSLGLHGLDDYIVQRNCDRWMLAFCESATFIFNTASCRHSSAKHTDQSHCSVIADIDSQSSTTWRWCHAHINHDLKINSKSEQMLRFKPLSAPTSIQLSTADGKNHAPIMLVPHSRIICLPTLYNISPPLHPSLMWSCP